MGNRITALAPIRRASSGGHLVRDKPAGPLLIQSLIESIEGLKNTIVVQSGTRQLARYGPPPDDLPPQIEVQSIQAPEPPPKQVTVKRNRVLEFFD